MGLPLQVLFQQMQQQQPNAVPSPQMQQQVAPQMPNDPMALAQQAQQRGLQELTTQLGIQRPAVQQAQQLATSPYQTPEPQFGFKFSNNPFLRSIESILAATGPGQAVEQALHGGGRAARAQEMRERGQEIESLVGKEGVAGAAGQPLSAISGLTYHPMMAAGSAMRGQAAVMNVQTRDVHNRVTESLRSQFQQMTAQIAAGKLTAEQAHTQAMILIGQGHDQAVRDVAGMHTDQADRDTQIKAFEDEYKISTDNMFKQVFGSLFGITPTAPSAKPEAPAGPKAAGSSVAPKGSVAGKVVPKGTTVYDPQGRPHSSDGTHPLPKGWSLQPQKQ